MAEVLLLYRVYEDRLSDAISDELWTTKSGELQEAEASASRGGASSVFTDIPESSSEFSPFKAAGGG